MKAIRCGMHLSFANRRDSSFGLAKSISSSRTSFQSCLAGLLSFNSGQHGIAHR